MRYYSKKRLKVLECVSLAIGLPSCLSTCLLVSICLSASFPPSVGSGCCHTIHLIRPAIPSSLPVLTELCACVCVMWVGLCEASTQQSDDKYSQPSAPHELMDRQAKNTGGLVVWACVCVVVKRGKGEDWGLECVRGGVCVCVWRGGVCVWASVRVCFFLQQPRHQAMPHGCNLFISYVINVHTHTEVILFRVLPDWILK